MNPNNLQRIQPQDVGTVQPASVDILRQLVHTGSTLTTRVIVETLERMPVDVQDFALGLRYVSVGVETLGMAIDDPGATVILSDEVTRTRPYDAASIVAHEIAHHWLGHIADEHRIENRFRHEVEACYQVQCWGFTGFGANIEAQYSMLAGKVRDIFGVFPELQLSYNVDEYTKLEVAWLAEEEHQWDKLKATFTSEQQQLLEAWQHARKQSESCRLGRLGFGSDGSIEPPTPN